MSSAPFEHTIFLEEGKVVLDKLLGEEILVLFHSDPSTEGSEAADFILTAEEFQNLYDTFDALSKKIVRVSR